MTAHRVVIFGQKLAALRRERYLTQDEFAQRLEMWAANVRRLEQAQASGMQLKNFRRLASLLNVSPDELRRQIGPATAAPLPIQRSGAALADGPADFPSALSPDATQPLADLPHYHGVSAARIEHRTDASRGTIQAPAGSQRRFAVTVDGDCMEPRYANGDVVIFSIDAAEREGVVDGKNYFIQFTDGENTFKRLFTDPDNPEVVILRCWNEKYAERVVERSAIRLLARAVFKLTPDE